MQSFSQTSIYLFLPPKMLAKMRICIGLLLSLFSAFAYPASLSFQPIAPGIYVHNGVHEDIGEGYHGDICNLSFVVGTRGVAVIDTGGSLRIGLAVLESIKKVTSLPVLYVINTHVHPDHIFGNAAFVSTGAAFVGHARLADAMERRREQYIRLNQNWLGQDAVGSEIIKPSITVTDSLTLDLGDRALQLHAHPVAHTNTDLSIIDSETQTFWTGDLLFVERTPSIDGDIKGWLKEILLMQKLSVKKTVPGHGPVLDTAVPGLQAEHRYLSALLEDVRRSIKQGEMMEVAMDKAASSEKPHWLLFDIVNRRNVNLIYPQLEWE